MTNEEMVTHLRLEAKRHKEDYFLDYTAAVLNIAADRIEALSKELEALHDKSPSV